MSDVALPVKSRDTRSKRLQQRQQWQAVRARLPMGLKKFNFEMTGHRATEIYGFAKEVARMYVALHGDPEDLLHVSRKETLEQAISAVYSEKDAGSLAYEGDLDDAMKEVCVLMLNSVCPGAELYVSLR